jgi:predicted extracellular nuclease
MHQLKSKKIWTAKKLFCMKLTWSIFILVFPLFLYGQQESYDPGSRFTIAFYNTEDLFDTRNDPQTHDDSYTPYGEKHWTTKRYHKKIDRIGRVLTSLNSYEYPEIIGLAEVENRRVLKDLVRSARFSDVYYGIVHENSPDTRGIDVAMLYRPDEFQYLRHQSIPIIFPFDRKSKVRDILHITGIALDKDTLDIFINHWKSRSDGKIKTQPKRIYSAKILKKHIDSLFYHKPDPNIVIIGDFNDEPDDKSLAQVLGAKCINRDAEGKELYNLLCEEDREGRGTYNYKNKWYMLDNFMVSSALLDDEKLTINKQQVKIFDPPWVMYKNAKAGTKVPNRTYGGNNYFGGFSDHLAIYGIFKFTSSNP